MKKILTIIIFISLIIFGGCGVKDGDKDTHYKPEEFKHNVAINQARNTMRDVEKELLDTKVGETSADVVYDIYNNSLKKLNDELTNLEKTKKLLSEDKELSKSEIQEIVDNDKLIENIDKVIQHLIKTDYSAMSWLR